jgi:hypothetical protein
MSEIMTTERRKERIAEQREQQSLIASMRLAGASRQHIARALSLTVRQVNNHLQKLADSQPTPEIEALRQLEAERLDRLQVAVWSAAVSGSTQAIDTVLKISQRRSKLLGLDAPTRIDVSIRQEMEDALQALHQVVMGEVLHVADQQYAG